jgi:hypothetical protein
LYQVKSGNPGSNPDHPIDPPKADHDPWECEFPEDCGYELKPVNGVYNVFKSKDDVISGKPIQVCWHIVKQLNSL